MVGIMVVIRNLGRNSRNLNLRRVLILKEGEPRKIRQVRLVFGHLNHLRRLGMETFFYLKLL